MYIKKELTERLIKGDSSAFNEVYHLCSKYVYFIAIRYLKDEGLAKDICQEVFVKLWLKRASLKPDKSLGNWLYLQARSRAIDLYRHRYFDCLSEIDESVAFESYEDVSSMPDHELNKAIGKLPRKYRNLLTLKYRFGLKSKQISEKTGLSISHIRNCTCEAIKLLRKDLKNNLAV